MPGDGLKTALPVTEVEIIRHLEIIPDQKIDSSVRVEVTEQDGQCLTRNAGQVDETVPRQTGFRVEHDAVAGLLARHASIPARCPVPESEIQIAIPVDIAETGRQGENGILAVTHALQASGIETAAAIGQDVEALTIGGQEEIPPAIIVDIHEGRIEHRQVGDRTEVQGHFREPAVTVIGVNVQAPLGGCIDQVQIAISIDVARRNAPAFPEGRPHVVEGKLDRVRDTQLDRLDPRERAFTQPE